MYYLTYRIPTMDYEVWCFDSRGMKQSYGYVSSIENGLRLIGELTGTNPVMVVNVAVTQ